MSFCIVVLQWIDLDLERRSNGYLANLAGAGQNLIGVVEATWARLQRTTTVKEST
jgi:hypothetical protein